MVVGAALCACRCVVPCSGLLFRAGGSCSKHGGAGKGREAFDRVLHAEVPTDIILLVE